MKTVAEVLSSCLLEAGIDTVYGLPGGETVELLDTFRRDGIRFVLVHRECAAAFMASASARLTGRPSACLTTLGPGATNVVTGVAHAFLDRAPILLITAQTPEKLLSRHTHQVVDLAALFKPVTKTSFALTAQDTAEMVRHAIALTTTGRPGPVHLRLSNEEAAWQVESEDETAPSVSFAPALENIEIARDLITKSRRPVLLVGLGLEPERPYRELVQLAESLRAPVIVTPKAKGAITDEHPLSVGTIGLTKTDPVYEVLEETDCVLTVGFDVVELVRPWEHPAPLIWLGNWTNRDPMLPVAVELLGAAKPVLERLGTCTPRHSDDWGEVRVAKHLSKYPRLAHPTSASDSMTPQEVLRVLRERLPREGLLTTDVGSHKIFFCLEWPAYTPNRFLVSNGLSSMGYGLPAAIAASLALPDTPVVSLTGDAGLLMTLGELNTLAALGTSVTVLVMKDHALDLIRSHQKRSGKQPFGTEFSAPDFVKIAEAHGIPARRVSHRDAFDEVLKWSLDTSGPTLIEAEIDPSTYPTTPQK